MIKIFIIFLLLLPCILNAQNGFDLILNKSNTYEYSNIIKEVSADRYVVNVMREQPAFNNQLLSILYLLDHNGNVITSDSLISADTTFIFSEVLPYNSGIIVCGYYGLLATNFLGTYVSYYDLSDNLFNLIWRHKSLTNTDNGLNQWYTSPMIKPGTDSCFIGGSRVINWSMYNNFIYCFNAQTGDSILQKFVPTPENYQPVDLFFSSIDTSLHLMYKINNYYNFGNILYKFSKDYNIIDSLPAHTFLGQEKSKSESHSNGNIILAGATDSLDYVNNILWHSFGIFRYQNDLEPIDHKLLITPHTDTTVQTAWRESLRINQDGEIFILSNYNFKGFPLDGIPTIGYIAKLDADLNLLWEKYIGGDKYYSFFGIDATSDGGAVIAAYCYDKNDPSTKGYAWVCKFDENGVVGVNEPSVEILDVLIYPNPGKDIINVNSNHSKGILEIYTTNGQMVHKQQAIRGTQEIDVRDLKVGTYLLTLKNENKIIYSQKFQKSN